MLISYGNYNIAFTLTSGPNNNAAFLTPSAALNNGRSGDGASIKWDTGTGTITTSFVQLNLTITSALDSAAAAAGAVGLVNVQGLPIGTKVTCGAQTQRLVDAVEEHPGELCSWMLPFTFGNTLAIKIWNDVNGSATIAASTVFAIGEVSVGRCMFLPGLVNASPMNSLYDPTALAQTAGGSDWQTFRKPRRQAKQKLGIFTRGDAELSSASSLFSGAASSGKISLRRLMGYLATMQTGACCEIPLINPADVSKQIASIGGFKFGQADMQSSWMLARATNLDSIVQDQSPYYSWAPTWSESR